MIGHAVGMGLRTTILLAAVLVSAAILAARYDWFGRLARRMKGGSLRGWWSARGDEARYWWTIAGVVVCLAVVVIGVFAIDQAMMGPRTAYGY